MEEHKQYNLPDSNSLNQHNGQHPQEQGFITGSNIVRTDKDLIVKDLFNVTDTEIFGGIGRKLGIRRASGDYTALLTDFFIIVNQVVASTVVTLPKASLSGVGKVYIVADTSGSALATSIAISPQTGETINGDTGTSINTDYGKVGFFTDGSNWFVV